MSPTAYYCWLYERPVMWLGLKRLKPRPDQNFPLAVAVMAPVIFTALCLGVPAGLVAIVDALSGEKASGGLPGFFFWVIGIIAMTCATFHTVFACLAWNQRAARQRAAGCVTPAARPAGFVRWLLGPIYLLLIGVVTPFALLTAVENVRGALRWKEVKSGLLARGEKLTMAELLGPPVPAEQNFGSLPMFSDLLDYGRKTNLVNGRPVPSEVVWANTNALRRFQVFHLPDSFLPKRGKDDHRPVSLAEWAVAFRTAVSNQTAQAKGEQRRGSGDLPTYPGAPAGADAATVVLAGLKPGEADMVTICEASLRPYCRFGVHWEEGFNALLPTLAQLKGMQRFLSLRVEARLASGDAAGAYADALCALRVADLARDEPLLISQLVRIAQAAIAGQAVWHGIAAHRWSDAQLQELQKGLLAPDYLRAMGFALEGERNGCIAIMDRWATNPRQLQQEASGLGFGDASEAPQGIALQNVGLGLMPRGWVRQNQAAMAEYHQLMIGLNRQLATNAPSGALGGALKQFADRTDEALIRQKTHTTPYNVFANLLAPALGKAIAKAGRAGATARSAATGCALERHRIKHGSYPESLAALVPEFLAEVPVDPIDGQPLRYRRSADGLFRLWSVGDDGVDNGGERSAKGQIVDWVWPY